MEYKTENLQYGQMSDNEIVKHLDYKYKTLIVTVIRATIIEYPNVPITWEDIYYEFLFKMTEIIREFDLQKELPIKTFIGIKCKFFTKNYCRHFTSTGFSVLNESIEIQDWQPTNQCCNINTLDTQMLNLKEFKVYEMLFVYDFDVKRTADELNIKKFQVRNIRKSILSKMKAQLKN